MYPKDYLEIINDICIKNSIQIKTYCDTSILCLIKEGIRHYIWSRRFDLNSSISTRIADNKYETYQILREANIPIVTHQKIYRVDTENYNTHSISNLEICIDFLKKHSTIILKPNNSYEGNDVYKCSSIKEIEQVLFQIGNKYKFLVVTPYVSAIAEYRCFYLQGQILLIYRKNLPYIIADGKSTLLELLTKKQHNTKHVSSQVVKNLNKIYPENEKVYLNWKFNLSQGSFYSTVSDAKLCSKLKKIASNAASAINITFATVDILEDTQGNLQVLEINAGVAMDQFIQQHPNGRDIAYSIYEQAILSMFNG